MKSTSLSLTTEQQRRRALDIALRLVEGTRLAPKQDERVLLELFVHGQLTIDQVIDQLEAQEHE